MRSMIAIAALAASLAGGGAHALAVEREMTLDFDEAGQDLTFRFGGLLPSDGTGGWLRIEGGGDPDVFPGIDLLDVREDERAFVTFDGAWQGTFSCDGNHRSTRFDVTVVLGPTDCSFAQDFVLGAGVLDEMLADRTIEIGFATTRRVDGWAEEGDFVRVSFGYEADPAALAAIPLPGAGLMLLGAIAGIAASRRRSA